MSRNPYGTDELDRLDPDLDQVATELERYAATQGGEAPLDLAGRIHAAIEAEPDPPLGWRRALPPMLRASRGPARGLAVAAVLVVAVVGALALGEVIERARRPDVGASPTPPAVISPSPSPSPSAAPSRSPSPSASPSVAPTNRPRSAEPSASESEEAETPEPSESDNSGPGGGGGGGGDNSGPGGGGGGGDNSGPGGGG